MIAKTDQSILLDLAAASIKHGLETGSPLPVDNSEYSRGLQQLGASFVTLNINHQLRGCIGCLEAYRPLVEDVVENAFSAAFRDPRFPKLSEAEFPLLHYHISILGKAEPIAFVSERELIAELQPGVDGLIIEDGFHRATFLPSVWESLQDPTEFLTHLKLKAGLSKNHWSNSFSAKRYYVEDFQSD